MKRYLHFQRIAAFLVIASLALGYMAWQAYRETDIIVEWSTASELDVAGFDLYRSTSPNGPFEKINSELIPPAVDPLVGGDYVYTDSGVEPDVVYYYNLEEIEISGATATHGPIEVKAARGGLAEGALAGIFLVSAVLVVTTGKSRGAAPATLAPERGGNGSKARGGKLTGESTPIE